MAVASTDFDLVSEDSGAVREDLCLVSEDSEAGREDSGIVREDSEGVSEDSEEVSEDSEGVREDSDRVTEDSGGVSVHSDPARVRAAANSVDFVWKTGDLGREYDHRGVVACLRRLIRRDLGHRVRMVTFRLAN